jgi:hypothetical protein
MLRTPSYREERKLQKDVREDNISDKEKKHRCRLEKQKIRQT